MDGRPAPEPTDLISPHHHDWTGLVADLGRCGAASLPALSEEARESLLAEAGAYPYADQPERVGNGDRLVRQQLASCEAFPSESSVFRLRDALQSLLTQGFATLDRCPIETPLAFNDLVLQRYPAGSLGITPHRDGLRYVNLICIVVLGGHGRVYVCRDRAGTDPVEIDASPGRAILLRAPGFRHVPRTSERESGRRPFHAVADISGTRYTLGLRQRATREPD